jgi:large conductance mechanosensitive channel
MLKEFKSFIMTGNLIDIAVGLILAGAVGGVISGFVNDIMMPIVGYFTGGMDFASMSIPLGDKGAAINYGKWINALINLVIVGFVLFMIMKAYNKSKKKAEEAPNAPAGPSQEELLAEIRDLLKK